jgi:hypothetical protein
MENPGGLEVHGTAAKSISRTLRLAPHVNWSWK